jgi:hypothetical protein
MPRAALLAVTLLAACGPARPRDADDQGAGRTTAAEPTARRADGALARDAAFDAAVSRIAARRAALSRRYAAATTEPARAAIRAEARGYLLATIRDDLFPLWLGTPWGLGRNSTATRPHQPGMTVGCSYFVTAILGNAGFRLDDRYRFARAPALDIQHSLARGDRAVRRFLSIAPRELERRIAGLGDGLWLIGLSNHVGWVVVDDGAVRFVHASWTGAQQVSDEPFGDARAIAVSQRAGYFVSPVLVDTDENDDLVDAWLRDAVIAFRP